MVRSWTQEVDERSHLAAMDDSYPLIGETETETEKLGNKLGKSPIAL